MFFGYVCQWLALDCIPYFYLFAAVELGVLGFLLAYSGKDIQRYLIIIIASCVFRFIMAGPHIYTLITVPRLRWVLLGATIYDILSAAFTLVLLYSCGYFQPEGKEKNKEI